MPIFISYSHKDKYFVDRLAKQLIRSNVHVWLDRWELSVGDSIVDKVQEAVDGASALLVILSKASVESEWCKKELSAGLLRELEERRVVVMPVMLEECSIPIFARGKMFADFRTDFDTGFKSITEGIAKVTNASLGRIKEATYHTDWSIDWGDVNGQFALILSYVQVPNKEQHTCLTNVEILATPAATQAFEKTKKDEGVEVAKLHIVKLLLDKINEVGGLQPRLADEREQVYRLSMTGTGRGEAYDVRIGVRRLGEDSGRDILVNTGNVIASTYQHMAEVLGKPKSQRQNSGT